jgi:Tfp pilus assembly protein PilF
MKKNLLIAFLSNALLLLGVACGNPQTNNTSNIATEKEKIMTEVIAVHDEVMPMMNKIEDLQTALRADLKTATSEEQRAIIFEKLTNLEKADKAMYEWMDNFKTDFPNMTDAQIIDYLNGEKISVTKMATTVKAAITAAETK